MCAIFFEKKQALFRISNMILKGGVEKKVRKSAVSAELADSASSSK